VPWRKADKSFWLSHIKVLVVAVEPILALVRLEVGVLQDTPELCRLRPESNCLIGCEIAKCAIFCTPKKYSAIYRRNFAVYSLSQLSVPFMLRGLNCKYLLAIVMA
jgi:hypothetical protein